jgi:hypothetical protein
MQSTIYPARRFYASLSLICALSFLFPFTPWSRSAAQAADDHATKRVDWRLEKTTGDKPSARGAGKWVPVGNKLVMYGGFYECFDKNQCEHGYFDDVYTFDVTTGKWEKKNPKSSTGAFPGKRVFMGAAPYKKNNAAVFFGGVEYNAKVTSFHVYGDLWEYNPQTDTWTQRSYANQGPGARLGAEIVIKDDTLYLLGGYDETRTNHNDLWSYDLRTNTWNQLRENGDPQSPSRRYIFRFELDEAKGDIYIFGGNYREKVTIQRNDVWKYHIASDRFTELVSETATKITGRTHGAGAVFGGRFLIALGDIPSGGCFTNQDSEHQNPTNEVWSLLTSHRHGLLNWTRVQIGFGPPPLKRVFYAKVGDRLYVTHGFNYKCDTPSTEGPIYNLDMYSLPLKEIR